ncbi:MAG: CmcI family methyltransferase [Stellaceae bacterium]
MKLTIDTDAATVTVGDAQEVRTLPLATAEAFELVSEAWLRVGWDVKYVYSFTWLGRPMIQLPEDMIRLQEVIYALKPDVIIETGIAHGGGLVFYAGLCRLMGKGRVIGVERELRPRNRAALEGHSLFDLITLVDGDSVATETVARVKALVQPGESVLVLLDSNHTKAHVLAELDAYAPLVTLDSYIVVMDGIMASLAGAPRSNPAWVTDNPGAALREWIAKRPEFSVAEPDFVFNEGAVAQRVTYWPEGFIRRIAR